MPAKFLSVPQLSRFTMPIATEPTSPSGYDTDLGDLALFDLAAISTKAALFGMGKVWTFPGGFTINAFTEPQYSLFRSDVGVPKWQIYGGVNLQFPL